MTNKMQKLIDEIDRSEAEIIKAALEAQGIQAELYQEGAGVAYGFTVGMLGEVEIWVATDHFEAAQAWLNAYDSDTLEGLPEEES
jgi:hypothetical protein